MSESASAFYKEVGERIATARKANRWSQAELAESLKIGRSSLANIERGQQSIALHLVVQIAQALALDLSDLVPTSIDNPHRLQAHKASLLQGEPEHRVDFIDRLLSRGDS